MIINQLGKETSKKYSSILATLPPILVNIIIEGKFKTLPESIIFLQENDPTFREEKSSAGKVYGVERLLNSVELIELLSFIGGLKKKSRVLLDNHVYQYGTFRGALYGFLSGARIWSPDLGAGFHSKSQEDILETQKVFDFLISKSN